jgi:hypothetical protein
VTPAAPSSQVAPVKAVPAGLTPFSADEVEQLMLYRELVTELTDWELANRQQIQIHVSGYGLLESGIRKADLVALSTSFRKLGWSQDEPATFSQVRNLIGKHAHESASPEAAAITIWLKDLKNHRAAALRESQVLAYELEHSDGTTETLRPEDVLNMLINGAIFHSDRLLRERWKQLDGWKSPALVMIAVLTIRELIRMFQELEQLVETILATPALLPPAAPSEP